MSLKGASAIEAYSSRVTECDNESGSPLEATITLTEVHEPINVHYALPEYDEAVRSLFSGLGRGEMRQKSELLKDCSTLEKDQLADTMLGSRGEAIVDSTFVVEGLFILSSEDALAGNYSSFINKLRDQQDSMLEQIEKAMMTRLSDVCDHTGQVVRAGPARILTYGNILDMLEKTEVSFTYEGVPKLNSFATKWISDDRVVSISLAEMCSTGPNEFRLAVEQIISKKREAFLANRRFRRLSR